MANCLYSISPPGIVKMITILMCLITNIFLGLGFINSSYVRGLGNLTQEKCEAQESTNVIIDDKYSCPNVWFLKLAASINMIAFFTCLIVFVVLLIFEMNKNNIFRMIDAGGHILGALCMFSSGTLCIVYCILAVAAVKCNIDDSEKAKVCWEERTEIFQTIQFTISGALFIINGLIFLLATWLVWKDKKKE